jgi:hypothetical protein
LSTAATSQALPERRREVDERRRSREDGAHEETDEDRDEKPRVFLLEENARGPEGVKAEEAARRHERQREQQDPCVPAPVGRLTGGVAEGECDASGDPEDDEVQPVVLDVRVELLAEEERDEADERQRHHQQHREPEHRGARSSSERARTPSV